LDILTNIILLLKERNKKQIDLTNYLGVTKNIFTDWKAGRNTSYTKHLPKIAEFFGVSVDYLLGKENPTSENNFSYALYNELAHDLSPDQIQQLKQFADFLRNGQKQKQTK
jgi:transcriptional regulator with XRE-family HTH domain